VEPIIQLITVIGGTLALAVLFGLYIARLIAYETRPLERTLSRVENGFFRVIGIDKNRQMTWKEYFLALILTNGIVFGFVFFVLLFQDSIQFCRIQPEKDSQRILHLIRPFHLSPILICSITLATSS
jgi:K+-transporting ATPase A subunit